MKVWHVLLGVGGLFGAGVVVKRMWPKETASAVNAVLPERAATFVLGGLAAPGVQGDKARQLAALAQNPTLRSVQMTVVPRPQPMVQATTAIPERVRVPTPDEFARIEAEANARLMSKHGNLRFN